MSWIVTAIEDQGRTETVLPAQYLNDMLSLVKDLCCDPKVEGVRVKREEDD